MKKLLLFCALVVVAIVLDCCIHEATKPLPRAGTYTQSDLQWFLGFMKKNEALLTEEELQAKEEFVRARRELPEGPVPVTAAGRIFESIRASAAKHTSVYKGYPGITIVKDGKGLSHCQDEWGRDYMLASLEWAKENGYVFLTARPAGDVVIWSVGPNGVDEFGYGDDITIDKNYYQRKLFDQQVKENGAGK